MTNNKIYRHSGKFGLFSPILMILLGSIGVGVVGVAYGYLVHYNPLVYFNFLGTLIYGFAVGFLVSSGAKAGKVRNNFMATLFGLIFGAIAVYFCWVVYFYAQSKQAILLYNPTDLWTAINVVAERGVWSMFDWTPRGTSLYVIWGLEAAIIFLTTVVTTHSAVSSLAFCENCKRWTHDESVAHLEPVADMDKLMADIDHGNLNTLQSMQAIDLELGPYTEMTVSACPSCDETRYLTLKSVIAESDKDGDVKKQEEDIVVNYILSPEEYRMVHALS